MPSKKFGSTTATLSYAPVQSKQLFKLVCKKCRTKLSILQPNQHRPYQFLAVCGDCEAWYRIEIQAGDPRGVIVDLPEIIRLLPTHDDVSARSAV